VSDAGRLARGVVAAGITGTRGDERPAGIGAYVLFGGEGVTLRDIRALTDELRECEPGLPPLIAIDQEGGRVARLSDGVEPIPPMMAVGAAGDVDPARRAGEQIAFDLRRAGATLDFAPVLDLALDPGNAVIGTRSFGDDPSRVAALGAALAAGLLRGGIVPCYKHFPGHGSTATDSHDMLPRIDTGEAALRARDLVPFAAVARDAAAMMTGHLLVDAFDSEHPATLSSRITVDLLRGELGFRGAVVTDCMEMGAVAPRGVADRAVAAVAAGADLLVFSHDAGAALEAIEALARAAERGVLSLARLTEAHARVMQLRAAGAGPLPLEEFPPHPGIGREIARRAVTLLRGLPHADPLTSIAVSFGAARPLLDREAPALEEFLASLDPAAEEREALLGALASRQRRPIVLARAAHRHAGQAETIARVLERYPGAMIVSVGEPFDAPLFSAARHVLAAYGDDPASVAGLADVIFGGSMPTGTLPVHAA
jgi:beta-N-acetylhexosaminidase